MKKKVLFSIVGIALFAMAIGFGFSKSKTSNNLKKNEVKAKIPKDGSMSCLWGCNTAGNSCYCHLQGKPVHIMNRFW